MSKSKTAYNYNELFSRNLGLISQDQQEKLKNTKVCVFGAGGIGGTAFEVLVRSGIGSFAIVDKDYFEASNTNRQIFCYTDTLGRDKVEVAKEYGLRINPEALIETYKNVDEDNIYEILSKSDAVLLGIDELKPCIIISRAARELKIPLVEGWAIPYGNVRTFTNETVSLEQAYGLPTADKELSSFSDEELEKYGKDLIIKLADVDGVADFYLNDLALEKIDKGIFPSFAPMVWLTSVMMVTEVIKVILSLGEVNSTGEFSFYDPFRGRVL